MWCDINDIVNYVLTMRGKAKLCKHWRCCKSDYFRGGRVWGEFIYNEYTYVNICIGTIGNSPPGRPPKNIRFTENGTIIISRTMPRKLVNKVLGKQAHEFTSIFE